MDKLNRYDLNALKELKKELLMLLLEKQGLKREKEAYLRLEGRRR